MFIQFTLCVLPGHLSVCECADHYHSSYFIPTRLFLEVTCEALSMLTTSAADIFVHFTH